MLNRSGPLPILATSYDPFVIVYVVAYMNVEYTRSSVNAYIDDNTLAITLEK